MCVCVPLHCTTHSALVKDQHVFFSHSDEELLFPQAEPVSREEGSFPAVCLFSQNSTLE